MKITIRSRSSRWSPTKRYPPPGSGDVVITVAGPADQRPWYAECYRDGQFIGKTGNCKTEWGAGEIGRALIGREQSRGERQADSIEHDC